MASGRIGCPRFGRIAMPENIATDQPQIETRILGADTISSILRSPGIDRIR
jgi:hypothetical protein